MSTRNTEVLKEILQTLEISEPHALARLENHFQDFLLVVAGTEADVARYAEELRLGGNFFIKVEGQVKEFIRNYVKSLPSKGKTNT